MLGTLCCVLFPALVLCCVFGLIGSIVGSAKEAPIAGFLLGFFLGPIGCLIAAFVDARPRCPMCKERIAPNPVICPHCQHNFAKARRDYAAQERREFSRQLQEKEERRAIAAERNAERRQAVGAAISGAFGAVAGAAKRSSQAIDGVLGKLAGGDEFMLWFFRLILLVVLLVALSIAAWVLYPIVRGIAERS